MILPNIRSLTFLFRFGFLEIVSFCDDKSEEELEEEEDNVVEDEVGVDSLHVLFTPLLLFVLLMFVLDALSAPLLLSLVAVFINTLLLLVKCVFM